MRFRNTRACFTASDRMSLDRCVYNAQRSVTTYFIYFIFFFYIILLYFCYFLAVFFFFLLFILFYQCVLSYDKNCRRFTKESG